MEVKAFLIALKKCMPFSEYYFTNTYDFVTVSFFSKFYFGTIFYIILNCKSLCNI